MLEFAREHSFDNIVLIQATSPLLQSVDLDRGFELFATDGTDSVISAVRQKRFYWHTNSKGYVEPTNYDVFNRPRRQDFEGTLVENGAFYITSKEQLLNSNNRVSGSIKAVEMDEDSFFEIDEPSDWIIIESLMKRRENADSVHVPDIKVFLTDCDGCLTDGGMYYSENGDELKKFNTKDGMGFAQLKKLGIITGIITGESVTLNRRRAEKLQLEILKTGCKNKLEAVMQICEDYEVSLNNICYIGDDINDIAVLSAVGHGCCPSDAVPEVKAVVDFVTKAKGGEGVIREVADQIVKNRIITQL
jgi:N-acylneuraminate cytidylyltransferase